MASPDGARDELARSAGADGFGARYSLYRSIGLHARSGWPIELSLGMTF